MYKALILMLQILKGFHSMARESLNSGVPNFDSELSLSKTKSARLLFGNNSLRQFTRTLIPSLETKAE